MRWLYLYPYPAGAIPRLRGITVRNKAIDLGNVFPRDMESISPFPRMQPRRNNGTTPRKWPRLITSYLARPIPALRTMLDTT
jgi:hypothetical protein